MSRSGNKKICLILGSYYEQIRGGAEYQAYLFASKLLESGHEVHYIYVDRGNPFEKKLNIVLHPIKRSSFHKQLGRLSHRFSYVLDAPRILHILKLLSPDIIYQRTGTAHTGIAAYYAKKHDKCLIWHIASLQDVLRSNLGAMGLDFGRLLDKYILSWGISNANMIIAQATYQAEVLEKNYARQCKAIIPNFHPITNEISSKPIDICNVVWIANFKQWKQPQLFLDLAEAFKCDSRVTFFVAGRLDKGYQNEFLQKLEMSTNVQYLGELAQDEVNLLLDKAHILVNTSRQGYEGFPNIFIQAWMHCVPVLSLNIDPDNVLKKHGLGFCSGTMSQLVDDCRMLMEDRNLCLKLGEQARNYVVSNHDLDKNIEKMLEIIK